MLRSMVRAIVATAAVLIWTAPSLADPPATLWSRDYGGEYHDRANAICEDGAGGFVLVGFADSHPILHPSDLWLLNVDADGDTLWTRKYGGASHETGNAVCRPAGGGYVVTGATRSFGPATPAENLWLLRLDAAGDTLWTRAHGGDFYDYGYDVLPTADGGYLVAGEWGEFSCGSTAWLLKTDAEGDEVWSRRYGSPYFNCAHALAATAGGYIVAGRTELRRGDDYHDDLWLLRTDAAGDTLWTRRYGGDAEDRALSLQVLPDGGFLVAGHTASFGAGGRDLWLLRTDAVGDTLWTRTYGGAGEDYAESVRLVAGGGFVVAGHTTSFGSALFGKAWLLRCDAAGDTLWTGLYGAEQTCTGRALHVAGDGGFVMAGQRTAGYESNVWALRTVAEPIGVASDPPPGDPLSILGSPNPFYGATVLRFSLAEPQDVRLDIYDLRGARVARLVAGMAPAGSRQVAWNGRDRLGRPVAGGVYLARLAAGRQTATRRLLLVR